MTHDDRFRALVVDDPDDPAALEHAASCADCAAVLGRVRAVRRIAPSLVASPRPGLSHDVADAVMERIARERPGPPGRARLARALHALGPRLAAVAVVVAVLAAGLEAGRGDSGGSARAAADLSDALLVSAQTTEDAGSARLHLEGTSEVRARGRRVAVTFGGVGALTESRLRYRGLARVGEVLMPCELTVVGPDAWTRRSDGMWLRVDEPVGALAPVVLDAGSILGLLRMPKNGLRLVSEDESSRTVAFEVNGGRELVYEMVAVVGRDDDLLRQVDIEAATDDWSTRATMRLYGFGEPVTIRRPTPAEIAGSWAETEGHAVPVRALFPVG